MHSEFDFPAVCRCDTVARFDDNIGVVDLLDIRVAEL